MEAKEAESDRGGGFFLRNLGDVLTLCMTDSYFGDNGAAIQEGAGLVRLLKNSTIDAIFTGNIGEDNEVVWNECSGFFFHPFPNTISGSNCRSVDEDISYY